MYTTCSHLVKGWEHFFICVKRVGAQGFSRFYCFGWSVIFLKGFTNGLFCIIVFLYTSDF